MKRGLSLLFALLVLLSVLPTAVLAETVAETISIDGYVSDNGWKNDEWIEVSEENGYLQTIPEVDTLSYRYQFRSDGKNLLGAVIVNAAPVSGGNGYGTNVRLWINTNSSFHCYTHFYDVYIQDGVIATNSKYNKSETENSSDNILGSGIKAAYTSVGSQTRFEFSIPLTEFGGKTVFAYYLAVSNNQNENVCLYHPAPAETETRFDALPYKNWDFANDIEFYPYSHLLAEEELIPVPSNEGVTYSSGCYGEEGYLYNVPAKLDLQSFLNYEPQAVFADLEGKQYVATGTKIRMEDGKVYTAVIYGDVNSDGEINAFDYLLMKSSHLGTYQMSPLGVLASKVEDTMTAFDYQRVKSAVLGTYDLSTLKTHRLIANHEGVKVAYIPLDNRPVNKDRLEFLAEASGIELLVPDEDLYRTALDNMTPNKNGTTFGDREALLAWLKSVESTCEYYVISLDQMISGGLVSSRWLDNSDLTLETEIADYLIQLAKSKTVVLFDTVMRLAPTLDYGGYNMTDYTDLREYAGIARKQFKGAELTISNIVANYRIGSDGNEIPTSISEAKLKKYYASRERKLRIIDQVLRGASEDFAAIYIGVDDSKPQVTVQTNEINYIQSIAGGNMTLFAGADELGLMGLAKIETILYGQANCNVTYFGGGENRPADAYDTSTLKSTVEKHLTAAGATVHSNDTDALQILVLTQSSNVKSNAEKLLAYANELIAKGKAVCIVDASSSSGSAQGTLQSLIISPESGVPISSLLGYSNWNTVSNAFGIASFNAICRYLYLYHGVGPTKQSHDGFVKVATFAFVKDISYRYNGRSDPKDMSYFGPGHIVEKINESKIMTSMGVYADHKPVSLSNFRRPWNRSFEATWDIHVG